MYTEDLTPEEAMSTIMSYISGPRVSQWKLAYCKNNRGGNMWTITSKKFWKDLDELFVDPNVARQALMRLQQCRMGTREATEFFTEFEELASMAGFDVTKDPPHMLDILEHALPRTWVQLWHDMNVVPTTYQEWKNRTCSVDASRRKFQLTHPSAPTHVPVHRPPPTPYKPVYRPPAGPPPRVYPRTFPNRPVGQAQIPTRYDATGTTYGGRGQPMDLDAICFKCHQKKRDPGTCGRTFHIPNKTGRTQIRHMYETDEREQLVEQLRIWAMEDPEDFAGYQQDLNDLAAASTAYEPIDYDQDFEYPEEQSHKALGQ